MRHAGDGSEWTAPGPPMLVTLRRRKRGSRMAKQQPRVNTRGIGLELQRLRKERSKLSIHEVGEAIGTSGSTISRIETGKREPTSEEVASILTVLGVVGVEREKLIDQARRQTDPGLLENTTSTEQSR